MTITRNLFQVLIPVALKIASVPLVLATGIYIILGHKTNFEAFDVFPKFIFP